MVQPPNYGGPPTGPEPQYPQGQGSAQPPGGQGPPYHPPPGQDPMGPPGGAQPPYPPPGGPPQYPPPPGGYGGGFGSGGEPPRKDRTGLIVGVVIGAVVLLGGLALLLWFLLRDDDGEISDPPAAEETSAEETTEAEEETTEAPGVDEAVGRCLPFEPEVSGYSFDMSTACESDEAFWEITAASDAVEASVDDEGRMEDPQVAYDVCGEEYGTFQPGEPWKDWYFTYDEATLAIEELYCVEAIGNPDPEGRVPVTPDAGACFDDSDLWWSVPCDSDLAVYEVVDTVAVDPPEELSNEEANDASSPCSGGDFFWQVTDVEGRTTAILCGDEL
ncbi:hypothetical protein [Glycomyces tarimensis]